MKRHRAIGSATSFAVCCLTVLTAGGAVYAQSAPAAPSGLPGVGHGQRPAFTATRVLGTVARVIVSPLGHVRGLLLDTGAVVMLGHPHHPPHLHGAADPSASTTSPVAIGTAVVVDGFNTAQSPHTIYRPTVYDQAGATVLVQPPQRPAWGGGPGPSGTPPQGAPPPHHHPHGPGGFGGGPGGQHFFEAIAQLPSRSASGVIRAVLAAPHGEVHGVVLHDGTSVFLGPRLARMVPEGALVVGQALRVEGQGNQYPAGGSMLARQLTLANGAVFTAPPHASPSAVP